jgi:hypothetical protein
MQALPHRLLYQDANAVIVRILQDPGLATQDGGHGDSVALGGERVLDACQGKRAGVHHLSCYIYLSSVFRSVWTTTELLFVSVAVRVCIRQPGIEARAMRRWLSCKLCPFTFVCTKALNTTDKLFIEVWSCDMCTWAPAKCKCDERLTGEVEPGRNEIHISHKMVQLDTLRRQERKT